MNQFPQDICPLCQESLIQIGSKRFYCRNVNPAYLPHYDKQAETVFMSISLNSISYDIHFLLSSNLIKIYIAETYYKLFEFPLHSPLSILEKLETLLLFQ